MVGGGAEFQFVSMTNLHSNIFFKYIVQYLFESLV